MPRLGWAARSSSTLEETQAHHFRSFVYCKKQVQTSLKQLCPTLTGKWGYFTNRCEPLYSGGVIREITGDAVNEILIRRYSGYLEDIFFPVLSIEHRASHIQL